MMIDSSISQQTPYFGNPNRLTSDSSYFYRIVGVSNIRNHTLVFYDVNCRFIVA